MEMPDKKDKKKINEDKKNKKAKNNATTNIAAAVTTNSASPEPKREVVRKRGKKFMRLPSGKLAPDNGIRAQG